MYDTKVEAERWYKQMEAVTFGYINDILSKPYKEWTDMDKELIEYVKEDKKLARKCNL